MDFEIIDISLFHKLIHQADESERRRVAYDLRTTHEDSSQRMLNAMVPGTDVPIHRHEDTSETNICIKGSLDVVFFDQRDDGSFVETYRVTLSPNHGRFGIQIPLGVWHTVIVYEPSVIFEGKDGTYKPR